MAVQAQHHSNLFFLNSNEQEENDYALKPQDTHFTFIKAGIDSRKRSRDIAELAPMNPPPSKTPRVHNRQVPNLVNTGLRLSHHHNEHLKNQEQFLPGDLTGEFKRQRDELDKFIQTQGEGLRRMLASSREKRYMELLCAAGELVRKRVREKEAELEKATRRNTELEARAAQLVGEARMWQVRAVTQEAEASSLQTHLHQAITGRVTTKNENMFRDGNSNEAEDAESVYGDPERIELIGPKCRICQRNSATVMALPCQHLVLCKACDVVMGICPICLAVKNLGVEVFFS